MPPNLLNDKHWSPENVEFRQKALKAVLEENLAQALAGGPQALAKAVWEMCEESYFLGAAFGDNVYTDDEIKEMYEDAAKRFPDMPK